MLVLALFVAFGAAVGVIAVTVVSVVRQRGMLNKFLKTTKLLLQYFYFRILKFVDKESNEYSIKVLTVKLK